MLKEWKQRESIKHIYLGNEILIIFTFIWSCRLEGIDWEFCLKKIRLEFKLVFITKQVAGLQIDGFTRYLMDEGNSNLFMKPPNSVKELPHHFNISITTIVLHNLFVAKAL